uniref:Putative 3-methyladenine DNA glycosylase n=1 Tax=Cyanothece sp. (strain PCC 7425 / ATCC 29141) TaxID=395961 RepID=B8HVZ4_CYAP4
MNQTASIVESSWLSRPSPMVAPDLIGCTLVRHFPTGSILRGLIVETEAYAPGDPACHAYRRPTPRNRVMFGPAGIAYVYLIYGRYCCLNVVTDREQVPSAVLIRAVELLPQSAATQPGQPDPRCAAGPGKLCQVMQITPALWGEPLEPGRSLWLEHRTPDLQVQLASQNGALIQTTRIGLTQGKDLPWRWYLKNSKAVSRR